MRLWQKLILGGLFLTSITAMAGAAVVIILLQRGDDARAAVSFEPPAAASPTTTVQAVVPTSTLPLPATPTPFQPLPITPSYTPSPTPTETPTPTPTQVPTLTPTADLPSEMFIDGIWGYPQAFNLSCESRSASDLARYYGVYFTELEFLYALPVSDNPDTGFVGDVHGHLGQLPPYGYGVHAKPVAQLMRSFGLQASAHKGLNLKEVKQEVAAGRPVMIWAISEMGTGTPVEYTASDGDTTIVARFEHTFIVIGYGPGYITLLDNERVYSVSNDQFLTSWGVLGNMGITVDNGP